MRRSSARRSESSHVCMRLHVGHTLFHTMTHVCPVTANESNAPHPCVLSMPLRAHNTSTRPALSSHPRLRPMHTHCILIAFSTHRKPYRKPLNRLYFAISDPSSTGNAQFFYFTCLVSGLCERMCSHLLLGTQARNFPQLRHTIFTALTATQTTD